MWTYLWPCTCLNNTVVPFSVPLHFPSFCFALDSTLHSSSLSLFFLIFLLHALLSSPSLSILFCCTCTLLSPPPLPAVLSGNYTILLSRHSFSFLLWSLPFPPPCSDFQPYLLLHSALFFSSHPPPPPPPLPSPCLSLQLTVSLPPASLSRSPTPAPTPLLFLLHLLDASVSSSPPPFLL